MQSGNFQTGDSGIRDLLWCTASGTSVRREGCDGTGQRIRKNRGNCGRPQRTSGRSWHGRPETTGCGTVGNTIMWMSHTDYIETLPCGFKVTAHTPVCPVAAMENPTAGFYATQFHPEVMHSVEGFKILQNFVLKVCGCKGDWKMDSFVETTIREIREKVGDGKVLCALSGGVDSSVAAVLLSKAVGKQLTCVFVDHGLLRKNEGDEVEAVFGPEGHL